MGTARSLTVSPSIWQGGVPARVGGVPALAVLAQGGYLPRYPPLWTEFLIYATENITLPQLRCGRE